MKANAKSARDKVTGIFLAGATAVLAVMFSGCFTEQDRVGIKAITTHLATVETNVNALNDAQKQYVDVQTKFTNEVYAREERVSDSVEAALIANRSNPPTNAETIIVDKELSVASKALPKPRAEVSAETAAVLQWLKSRSPEDQNKLADFYTNKSNIIDHLNEHINLLSQQAKEKQAELEKRSIEVKQSVDETARQTLIARNQEEARQQKEKELLAEQAAAQRDRIAFIFMLIGGLVIVGGIVATYLHVPGVLTIGFAGGGALLGIGLIISFISQWAEQTWFKVTVGAICLAVGGITAWIVYRSFNTRKEAALNTDYIDKTSAALHEMKQHFIKHNPEHLATIEHFLDKWHRTEDGLPHVEMQKHERKFLQKKGFHEPGARPAPHIPDGPDPDGGGAGTRPAGNALKPAGSASK